MGLITQTVSYRIASFVRLAKMRTNCCCAMDATKATTRTASNRKWSTFRKAIGELFVISTHSVAPPSRVPKANSDPFDSVDPQVLLRVREQGDE